MCESEKYNAISLIVEFLNQIGLGVEYTQLDNNTLFPGLLLLEGRLYIDRDKLLYPGELLYKAGQIAVAPSAERSLFNGEIEHESCDEMMVIAWCWAVLEHLDLSPEVIFYNRNRSPGDIIDRFNTGRFFGVPLLQWAGMTNEPTRDLKGNLVVFPAMIKWLRD